MEVNNWISNNRSSQGVIHLTNKEARRSDNISPTIEHKLPAFLPARALVARLEPNHGHELAVGVIVF